METILSFFSKAVLKDNGNAYSKSDFMGAAATFQSLSESDPVKILLYVNTALNSGVNIAHMGSLALYSNHLPLAKVLLENFNLRPEDYLTLGNDLGNFEKAGYPTLASAAYHSNTCIQERALEWGANPDAVWTVNYPQGHGNLTGSSATISWIAENIRAVNEPMVSRLLVDSKPASDEEQKRRLVAMTGGDDYYSDPSMAGRRNALPLWKFPSLKKLVDLFSPTGKYPMTLSPWDVDMYGTSLAAVIISTSTHRNPDLKEKDFLSVFDAWIKSTVPAKGNPYLDCVHRALGVDTPVIRLPDWCVSHLSPFEAQEILWLSWQKIMKRFFSSSNTSYTSVKDVLPSHLSGIYKALASQVEPLDALTQIAVSQAPRSVFVNPRTILAMAPSNLFLEMLSIKALDAIVDLSPVFPGQPAPIDQVREIYDAVKMSNDRFVSLKAGGPDLNKTDPLEPRFMAIFNQLRLEVEMSSTRTFDTPIRTSPKM